MAVTPRQEEGFKERNVTENKGTTINKELKWKSHFIKNEKTDSEAFRRLEAITRGRKRNKSCIKALFGCLVRERKAWKKLMCPQ